MRHVRMLGLCLVALFALAAVGAGSAMAEGPEWGRCLHIEPAKGKEIKKGNYEDPNCQKVATEIKKGKEVASHKGHYEWYTGASPVCEKKAKAEFTYKDKECSVVAEKKGVPDHKGKYEWGPGPKFTAEGGSGVLTASIQNCAPKMGRKPRSACTSGGNYGDISQEQVTCSSENATGEAVGTDELANVEVTFKGCHIFSTGMKSVGAEPGEIKTEKLKGRLGYIDKNTTPRQVGVLLQPASGTVFAVFRTEEEQVPLEFFVGVGNSTEGAFWTPEATGGNDGVISPITPVNEMSHTFTQDYRTVVVPYTYEFSGKPTEGKEVENVPSHFEGEPNELLEVYTENWLKPGLPGSSSAWSPAGEEITNVNTVEGEAEIKA